VTSFEEDAMVIENLTVGFSGKTVLNEISMQLRRGELTIIVGPSGSGKSTLLRSINRLNEFFPACRTAGSVCIRLDGQYTDVYKDSLPLPELRRKVGMVFQTPGVFPFSIEKNLTMPLRATLGMKGGELKARVESVLRDVSLWEEVRNRMHDNAQTLSGGQQQRLCIARVLALEPGIILLDEPTASLDFRATRNIEELLLELKKQYTILAVSHSLSQTRRLADRVFVLNDGRIVHELDRFHLQDRDVFQKLIEEIF